MNEPWPALLVLTVLATTLLHACTALKLSCSSDYPGILDDVRYGRSNAYQQRLQYQGERRLRAAADTVLFEHSFEYLWRIVQYVLPVLQLYQVLR